jgi:hypothetical protein
MKDEPSKQPCLTGSLTNEGGFDRPGAQLAIVIAFFAYLNLSLWIAVIDRSEVGMSALFKNIPVFDAPINIKRSCMTNYFASLLWGDLKRNVVVNAIPWSEWGRLLKWLHGQTFCKGVPANSVLREIAVW